MASAEARQDECLAWAAAFELAFVLGEGHVHHELALGRMTGNIPFARRILSQHDAPCGESADVAQEKHKQNQLA